MRIALTFAAAFGILAAAPLASAFASNTDGTTIDLSAQQNQNQQQKKGKAQPAHNNANRNVQHNNANRNVNRNANRNVNRSVNRNVNVHRSVNTNKPAANTKTRNITTTHTNKNNVTTTRSKAVTVKNNKPPRQVTFSSNRPTFTGTKARAWRNSGTSNFRGRNYSYWRGGPWRHRYNGGWRTYAAIGALSAILVGTATYYPYAYLDVPQNVCEGITEDGCQLSWAEVETEEGGLAPACVTYCPWE